MPPNPVPAVSVVLPAYNRAGSILAAVDSVLGQTFRDFELLVVDDGSSDGTMASLEGISDPRVRLLANPRNMGAGAARNTGIRAARAVWVAFQDSDDEWLPQKLEKQMARLDALGRAHVAVYCGMAVVGELDSPSAADAPGRTTLRYIPDPHLSVVEGNIRPALLRESLVSTQTLIARLESLLAIGGFDESLPALEDWDLALRLAALGPFAFVDEPLVMQHFSANSITRYRDRRLIARQKIVAKHLPELQAEPALLARHYRAIAGEQRRLGLIAEARASLAEARSLKPFDPKLWALSAYLWLKPVNR
jgi:glycosyltransferase involved in cell wall biosynthesis